MTYKSKVNKQIVLQIKKRILNGEKQKDIAESLEISQALISRIKNNREHQYGEDISGEVNYWSLWSPKYRKLVIKLYQKGNSEQAVSDIINNMNILRDNCRCDQSQITRILTEYKIEKRHKPKRIPAAILKSVIRLRKRGVVYRQISELLGISVTSAWYCMKKYKRALTANL